MFSLQKSIGSISQSLADAKRSGQIPDSARQVHTEAAVLINSIALSVVTHTTTSFCGLTLASKENLKH
jgi:hypothetical protein